jgi:hypothetical protein
VNPVPNSTPEAAAEAYAAGVAAAGGMLTDRVIAGATVAVRLAVEHADDPRILEVILDLGTLEGLWARLFQRREDLIRHHNRLVAKTWRELLTAELIADAVRALRRTHTERPGPAEWKLAVAAAAAGLLASLRSRPQLTALRQAVRDALAAAQAEGAAAGAVLAADRGGLPLPDWDTEFDTALDAVDGRYQLWADADTWTGRLLDRAGWTFQRALGDDPGAEDDDALTDDALRFLNDADSGPVPFTVDWAMTAAAASGALAAYTAQGQRQAAWLSVGDGRVCQACDTNEANGPYPLIEFPTLPAHPGCRCQAVPA